MNIKILFMIVSLTVIAIFGSLIIFNTFAPGHVELNIGKKIREHEQKPQEGGLQINIADEIDEIDGRDEIGKSCEKPKSALPS